jgi:hypothetical protein
MSVLKLNQIQTASGVIMANLNSSGANVGIQLASNLAPAFSAWQSVSQSIPNATVTKVTFTTEEFDTNNNFASSRFTPTVAGYYQINANLAYFFSSGVATTQIFKNGSLIKYGTFGTGTAIGLAQGVSAIIYMNGTTDYLEIYSYQLSGASADLNANIYASYFNGALVRSA